MMNRTVNDVEICASSHEIDLFCFHFKNTIICFSYFQFCLQNNLRCSDGIDRVDGKHLGHPLCCFKQVYEVQIYANTTTVTHSTRVETIIFLDQDNNELLFGQSINGRSDDHNMVSGAESGAGVESVQSLHSPGSLLQDRSLLHRWVD